MDEREQKALVIAATSKIEKRGSETWIVPSQSQTGKYAVTITAEGKACTCPDFELRQLPCKHVMAVQYVLFREERTEEKPDGTITTTTTEAKAVRVTYAQPSWRAYNTAQVTEKDEFCRLLRDLVKDIPTPPQTGSGNRRLALPDLLFGAAFKVYSGFSARRFMSDLRAARDQGHVDYAASYNAILEGMQSEEITPILHDLITATSLPLAEVERDFAVDSTGFGTCNYYRYYTEKYGREQLGREWVKTHACVGTKTNIVTAVHIGEKNDHDAPQFPGLVAATARNFTIGEVSADKAYSSRANLECVESLGGAPFIPFKSNAKPAAKWGRKSETWTRLYHYFAFNREDFCEHYHKRSNVEATFSMIKRVFGGSVRAKTPTAQKNEVLLKVICHNIRVLIHEMHELGIGPRLGASGGQTLVA